MDTPGTNAIIKEQTRLTKGFIPQSDLVIFVTSAERPGLHTARRPWPRHTRTYPHVYACMCIHRYTYTHMCAYVYVYAYVTAPQ